MANPLLLIFQQTTLQKERKTQTAIEFGKKFYAFTALREFGGETIVATEKWLKTHKVFMLLEIIDKKPDIRVVVIDEERKTDQRTACRPKKAKTDQRKVDFSPPENGVVILSTVVKPWKDGIFYVHNLKFVHIGRYVMRFTLVAPAACVPQALATQAKKRSLRRNKKKASNKKKSSSFKYTNFNSQDPEIIIRMLQERDMVTVSKPFDYAVNLLKEKISFLKGPLKHLCIALYLFACALNYSPYAFIDLTFQNADSNHARDRGSRHRLRICPWRDLQLMAVRPSANVNPNKIRMCTRVCLLEKCVVSSILCI